jgi:transcriptional regulator with PAS, ATPase and Fis domain
MLSASGDIRKDILSSNVREETMSDSKVNFGVRGLVVVNQAGRVAAALGIGEDPRIKALVTEREWTTEARKRRIVPVLLVDTNLVAMVKDVGRGLLVLLSEPPGDTVLEFILHVDFAYDIIEHVLTDPYDAMAIIDSQEKLAFISPVHEKFFGLNSGEAIGKKVRDVIENTRLHHVVRTGVAEVGQIHRMKGRDRIVSRHPIRHDGEIVGAIGRIMFKGPQQVEALARKINALEREIAAYKLDSREKSNGDTFLDAIIGQSLAIQSVRQQIRRIAPLDIPVLIQGESGTGKELVAQALHMMSPRQDARLVTVNAAALPESLVESELFGYEAGSFTGADKKGRAGKFELADKGTMFLDEIGDMSLEVQSKLLRVLQDRMVERVGGDHPKRVDFRLCSATNRNLEAFVEQGKFRLDLYYRISPVTIFLPSLQERIEDVPLLVTHFVGELAKHYGRPVPEVDMQVHEYLMQRPWPGNVRQLRHLVERAFIFSEPGRLAVADFERDVATYSQHQPTRAPPPADAPRMGTLKDSVDHLEVKLINDALIRFRGNKKRVAEYLGVSRSYLYKKLEAIT